MLIEEYPGSERMTDSNGVLPLHIACRRGSVETVQYLYKLYPESINVADRKGMYPIHCAIAGLNQETNPNPAAAVEIVQLLLDCNPNVALRKWKGSRFPLVLIFIYACNNRNNASN